MDVARAKHPLTLELTVVTTSEPDLPRGGDHQNTIHAILDEWIVPAVELGAGRR